MLKGLLPNRSILLSLINAARGVLGGATISILIANYFSQELQGYYYTFLSVLGLQVFVEMGLGTVVLQFASHEWANLRWVDGGITGDQESRARLSSLALLSLRWYRTAALISFIFLSICGYFFFTQKDDNGINWLGPWLTLVTFTALRFCMTPHLALLEGCGRQEQVYGYRLFEGLCAAMATIVAIMENAGLWAVAFSAAITQLCCFLYLKGAQRQFFRELVIASSAQRPINWRYDLLPMQWRIALSWMAGYFIFQLTTPLVFHYQGATTAGQVGMTLALTASVNSLASIWLFTKVPAFGRLIAVRKWSELDALAGDATRSAVIVALLGSLAGYGLLWALHHYQCSIATRFLSPDASIGFLIAVVFQQIIQAEAYYLRSFKREPLLFSSILCAIVTGLSTWMASAHAGPKAVGWAYCAATAFVGLPLSTWVFRRCRHAWQREPAEPGDALAQTGKATPSLGVGRL